MMKQEFEERIGYEITDEEWEIVETVYMWYAEELTKDDIAHLWRLNKNIVYDMYPRAKKIKELTEESERIIREIEELKKKREEIVFEITRWREIPNYNLVR